ncbi:MAG: cyclic nucleotide-binding domain-containing protein [Spirochaetes bacterium]|jgi:CRP-like cAMP-binding protein|nr:cyclic nucleotide-binding domain-containing protein [Spirochaetota bacterium]
MSKLFKYYGINVKKGEYLFQEGDAADYLYMIHQGEILINRIINGIEEKIKILEEGEFVGEMAIIDSKPRSANAIAIKDCQLIRMTKEAFEVNYQSNSQLGMSFLRFLSIRIRDTNEIVSFMLSKNRDQFFLLELAKEIIRTGKKDSTENWHLVDYSKFVKKMILNSSYNEIEVVSILRDICDGKETKVVTTKNNFQWIACKI